MKKIITLTLLLLTVLVLSGCRNIKDDKPYIYTTAYPVQFLVEEIAGDTVYVEPVPGSNVHSESQAWTAKEIISMQNANLLFYIGANLDDYIPENKENIFDEGDVELVFIGDYIEYEEVCYESHDHGHEEEEHHEEEATTEEDDHHDEHNCEETQVTEDPHFWLDVARVITVAEVVKTKLIEQFPENEEDYTANYEALLAKLNSLQADFEAMALEVTKPIITTNLLFNYWDHAYGIEILSLTADAHSSNTIPTDIIDFVNEALFHEVHFILFEANANSPAGDAVLSELLNNDPLAEKRVLYGLGTISSGDLDSGEDYISLMRKNLAVLNEVTK